MKNWLLAGLLLLALPTAAKANTCPTANYFSGQFHTGCLDFTDLNNAFAASASNLAAAVATLQAEIGTGAALPLVGGTMNGAINLSGFPIAFGQIATAPTAPVTGVQLYSDNANVENFVFPPGGTGGVRLTQSTAPGAPSSGGTLYVDSANVLHMLFPSGGGLAVAGGVSMTPTPTLIAPLLNVPSVASNTFYTDLASPHPTIVRLGDRVTLGYTNADPLTSAPGTAGTSWAGANSSSGDMGWVERDAAASFYTTHGGVGVAAAGRASDYSNGAAHPTINAVVGFGLADAAQAIGGGAYFEGRTVNATGIAVGLEADSGNYAGTPPATNPYTPIVQGTAIGQILAAGGDPSTPGPVYDSSSAVVIKSNASKWQYGITIAATALDGDDGSTGTASAIRMAKGHEIDWFCNPSAPAVCAFIRSDVGAGAGGTGIALDNVGIRLEDIAGNLEYSLLTPTGPTNGFQFTPGSTPTIASWDFASPTSAVPLEFSAQGAGDVIFGNANGVALVTKDPGANSLGWLTMTPSTSVTGTVTLGVQTTAGTEALNLGLTGQAGGDVEALTQFDATGGLTVGGKTVTLAGAFVTTGAHIITLNSTATTTVTLPTSGTLLTTTAPITLMNYTVATLPACNSAAKYEMAAVSDATTPTYNGALTGGGAVSVPVYCDGSAWTSH